MQTKNLSPNNKDTQQNRSNLVHDVPSQEYFTLSEVAYYCKYAEHAIPPPFSFRKLNTDEEDHFCLRSASVMGQLLINKKVRAGIEN